MKKLLLLLLILCLPTGIRADLIKQSATGGYPRTFLLTTTADRSIGATGLSPVVKVRKAGGAYATTTNTATEVDAVNDPGRYQIIYTATELNTLGPLDAAVTATGSNQESLHDQIVAFDPADPSLLGLTGVGTLANQSTLLTRIPGVVQPQTGDAFARLGAAGAGLTALGDTRLAFLTGDAFARLGAPTNASLSADLIANQAANVSAFAAIPGSILGATAASFNTANTIGAKINAAGNAGDPWATLLTSETTAGSFGAFVKTLMVAGNVTVGGYATGQDPATLLLANSRFQKMEAVETGAYTRTGNVFTFTKFDGSTFTMTLSALSSPTSRTSP